MENEIVDVLIIGAGPSGAVAAGYLQQHGVNIKVVEKQKYPRVVVGESLIPRVMDHFEEAGLLEALRHLGGEGHDHYRVIGLCRKIGVHEAGPACLCSGETCEECLVHHLGAGGLAPFLAAVGAARRRSVGGAGHEGGLHAAWGSRVLESDRRLLVRTLVAGVRATARVPVLVFVIAFVATAAAATAALPTPKETRKT